jgi:hypothetical protein
LSSFGIFPVEIGLLWAEKMEVVLFCLRIPGPGTAEEVADPVVWRLALAINIASRSPDVPVTLGVVFGRA